GQEIALDEVGLQLPEHGQAGSIFQVADDDLLLDGVSVVDDLLDRLAVFLVAEQILAQGAVDLEEFGWQVLDQLEGIEAAAEVIQAERHPQLAHPAVELLGLGEVGDGDGLVDLEAQPTAFQAQGVQLLGDEVGEAGIVQGGAGELDEQAGIEAAAAPLVQGLQGGS